MRLSTDKLYNFPLVVTLFDRVRDYIVESREKPTEDPLGELGKKPTCYRVEPVEEFLRDLFPDWDSVDAGGNKTQNTLQNHLEDGDWEGEFTEGGEDESFPF